MDASTRLRDNRAALMLASCCDPFCFLFRIEVLFFEEVDVAPVAFPLAMAALESSLSMACLAKAFLSAS